MSNNPPLKTVITVVAVDPDTRLGCCDTDGPAVWVRVTAWSPRRAFLTEAQPFMDVSGQAAEDLAGRRFFADLDMDNPPVSDAAGEHLEWPGLGLCPPVPREWLSADRAERPDDVRLTYPKPDLTVTVLGDAGPQGSKNHVGGGRMIESSAKVRPWRDTVAWTAIRERNRIRGWRPLTGEVALGLTFTLVRPKSHYGTGRNADRVRASAPLRPTSTPDLDKLIRSTQDALTTAKILRDDSLVVEYRNTGKWYDTDHGQVPGVLDAAGCTIGVWSLARREAGQ